MCASFGRSKCTRVSAPMHVCMPPHPPTPSALSLGRRQSQRRGLRSGCSCGPSGLFRCGRKALRSRACKSEGPPAGGSAALQSILDLFLSHLQALRTPTERKSQLHSACPPKTTCYDTHTLAHIIASVRVRSQRRTHTHGAAT